MAIPIILFAISFSVRKLFSVPFVDSSCPQWFYLLYPKAAKIFKKMLNFLSASSNFFSIFLSHFLISLRLGDLALNILSFCSSVIYPFRITLGHSWLKFFLRQIQV